jgi:hypothetical protein
MATALLLNSGVLLVALLAAVRAGLGGRPGRAVFATLCGSVILVHSLMLAAGLGGRLTAAALGGLVLVALGVALWSLRRRPPLDAPPVNAAGPTAAEIFAPLAAALAVVLWMWPHVAHATRLWIWDDYTYHLVYPTLWLRDHAVTARPPAETFTMQAWYPLSASLVAAWFMVPFPRVRGDALAWASLTGALYGGIVVTGLVELFDRLGRRRGAWALPVVLFATSHRTAVMAASFSDADLAVAALLLAALVFATPRAEGEGGGAVGVDGGYAGLLGGIALGVKASAAPVALVVLAAVAARAAAIPDRRRWRWIAATGLVFAIAWSATAGYWYVRNIVHTGNPVYPAAFAGQPGTTFPETTLREYAARYGLRRALSDAVVVYAEWPVPHALAAAAGLAGLGGWLAWGRCRSRPRRHFAWAALVATAAVLALLPAAPYSAGNAMTFRSGFIHWDSMRYVGLLPLLGWAALGSVVDAGVGAGRGRTLAAAAIAAGALLTATGAAPAAGGALVVLAVVAAGLTASGLARIVTRSTVSCRGEAVVVALGVALAALVATWHGGKAAATAAAFHREPLFGAAAAVLDGQPAGTRVALFGDQWVYPAFGARHDLVPVRVDGDGRVATTPIGDAMTPGPLTVDAGTLRANLAASRIAVVVVVHLPHPGRSPEWPAQQAALESIADARLLHRDGAVAVWRLGGGQP